MVRQTIGTKVEFRLPEDLREELDEEARKAGVTRAELVRRAVDHYLRAHE